MARIGRRLLGLCISLALAGAGSARADPFASGPEAFTYIHQVMTHPRCANCHGAIVDGQFVPLVGDDQHPHPMNIQARIVTLGYQCTSCHQDQNFDRPGMPPGAANKIMPDVHWHMPPPAMIIPKGMTPKALCEQFLDPNRNATTPGARGSLKDLATFRATFVPHMRDDPLVLWGFAPDPGRTPIPGTPAQLNAALDTWIRWLEAGHNCDELNG